MKDSSQKSSLDYVCEKIVGTVKLTSRETFVQARAA